nr:MAG TPA: hypothetical protein [Caudoviricetes sp.]
MSRFVQGNHFLPCKYSIAHPSAPVYRQFAQTYRLSVVHLVQNACSQTHVRLFCLCAVVVQ